MASRTYPLMSRRDIEAMIADGRKLIILDQYVVKADPWLTYHPGGDKAILHMVGRDATDEITVIHSAEARQQMDRYRIGRIEGRWSNFVPPIQGGKFRAADDDNAGDDTDGDVPESPSASARASSPPVSRDPSPVFDNGGASMRNRPTAAKGSTTPATPPASDDPVMAFFDRETHKKISLDLDKYPSLDFSTQDEIVQKYRVLHEQVKSEGLYQCNYTSYAIELLRYSLMFTGFLVFLQWGWYPLSAFCLGCFWHQVAFTVHDAGHMGITHNFQVDSVLGYIMADYFGGLSLGWWKRNHNVHHIVTNSPEHDPDIEHMPFMAVSHRLLGNLKSTYYDRIMEYDAAAKFLIGIQKYSYFVLLTFGRFNLYRLSWEFLLKGQGPRKGPAWWHRWFEIVGQCVFWYWYGYGVVYKSIPTGWDRFVYVMISHTITMPLHAQICLSHFAMSTSDLGAHESFPQKMLRTTMDIDCPQWLDFFHGGLQFQVIHHLYPRMPRHNLRRAQKLVQAFCDDVNIPYALYGFVEGNGQVIGRLGEVSRQAAVLAKCQEVITKSEEPLHGHDH
ncbi:hypothetical protein PG996_012729 [Apiospora saccharicola]|uniref:Delta 8-(E)-sphingolipid desaturase n=1 Tax=Apiospora saccharicola TaxID=335842 RepID=A0ABR1U3F4_9PEZI